jgi:LPXTG-site transpeptidase (sortase) family protein
MNNLHARKPSARLQRSLFFIGIPLVSSCATFLYLHTYANIRYAPPIPVIQTAPARVNPVVVSERVSVPIQLKLKRIGVDTMIKPVGLTIDGDMAIDDSIDTVAWYQLGPRPGEKGSAVIAGHYGWKDGQASVFNNLHTLKIGDSITTYDDKRAETQFTVREIRSYNPSADATEVFRSTDGKAHLNLITCIGTWSGSLQTYSQRLVVFADMVAQE